MTMGSARTTFAELQIICLKCDMLVLLLVLTCVVAEFFWPGEWGCFCGRGEDIASPICFLGFAKPDMEL
jgi:hypothetical protein